MEKHRVLKIEGWKYPVVMGIVFVICTLAVFAVVVLAWVAWDTWPVIMGTGEHSVRMTGGGK